MSSDLPGGDQYEALQKIADAVVHDVSEIVKDKEGADLGYNMYIEQFGDRTVGLIDMGDYYSAVFEWGPDGWYQTNDDPFLTEEHILAKRARINSGW